MVVGILLIQAVAFAVLSAIVANNKNRSPFGWSVIGVLFGLFGFVAALVVEEVEPEHKQGSGRGNRSSTSQEFIPDEHEKKCPTCAEYIKLEAKACRYCRHEFSDEEVERRVAQARKDFRERKQSPEDFRDEKGETASLEFQQEDMIPLGIVALIVIVLLALTTG
ncbi:hypothetical protein [Salinibacter sp.]|uniref:hypothetical protein n=1 Tax=Salinibacter sp. TaxID=2065818 RepID=UPI0021E70C97|nr:hypothetical protein [Salinibacter sp.]